MPQSVAFRPSRRREDKDKKDGHLKVMDTGRRRRRREKSMPLMDILLQVRLKRINDNLQ